MEAEVEANTSPASSDPASNQSVAVGPAAWTPRAPSPGRSVSISAETREGVVQNESPPLLVTSDSSISTRSLNELVQAEPPAHAADFSAYNETEEKATFQHLHDSIISGDEDTVSLILQQHPDWSNLASVGGTTRPLHLAVDHGRTFLISLLLYYGANARSEDNNGVTALHLAAKNGSLEAAGLLLEAGASLEAVSSDGAKPLWIAARANRTHVLELFLDKEADPDSLNVVSKTTALTEAAMLRDVDLKLVKMLLAHGADADGDVSLGISRRSTAEYPYTGEKDEGSVDISELRSQQGFNYEKLSAAQVALGPQPTTKHHIPTQTATWDTLPDISIARDDLYPGSDLEPWPGMVQPLAVPDVNAPEEQPSPASTSKVQHTLLSDGTAGDGMWKAPQENLPFSHSQEQLPMESSVPENYAPPTRSSNGERATDTLHFHDDVGRIITFPFHLVQTWQGMERLINLAFARIEEQRWDEGFHKRVLDGCYDIEGPEQQVIHPSTWSHSICPGWHVQQKMWRPDGPIPTRNITQHHQRPLHEALHHKNEALVELLLRYGANTRLRGLDGRSAHRQLAEDGPISERLAHIMQVGVTFLGPSKSPLALQDSSKTSALALLSPRPPPHGSMKWHSCRNFEATAILFHPDGDDEQYKSMSVYELLYEWKGEQATFEMPLRSRQAIKVPGFTWYHLPANNMEWVEHLMLNIFRDQHSKEAAKTSTTSSSAKGSASSELQHRLRALSSKAQKITKSWRSTRHSFLQPICAEVHDEETSSMGATNKSVNVPSANNLEGYISPSIVAFVPFLHFETFHGQRMATDCVKRLRGFRSDFDRHSTPQSSHPVEQLLTGYLSQTPTSNGIMGLQPRRSLDDYFFTHLQHSGTKDSGQVLWRFSKKQNPHGDPKIFMVDQLWMWILDESTIITCSPLNWDAWASEMGNEGGSNYLWQGEDPMNIQKKVIDHLRQFSKRTRVASVYEMAQLVADKCASLFDGHDLNDDLHFFDFFDQTIARVSHEATQLLEFFRGGLNTASDTGASNIQPEINLLIEVQDISDELGILKMVLKEQREALASMRKILSGRMPASTQLEESQVLKGHIEWVERMEETNKKTGEALHRLLGLKQAQYAAEQARHMAEQSRQSLKNSIITNAQLNLMREQADKSRKQLTMSTRLLKAMQKQSEEADKQSKTLLVFTVVTIVFLPSSFLATVFAINMDAFPFNSDGQMPLAYFLKYLFAISIAVCIPLLVLAFNMPIISKWLNDGKTALATQWENDGPRLLFNLLVPLAAVSLALATLVPVWTSTLSVTIKIAITVCVALGLLVGIIIYVISLLIQAGSNLAVWEEDSSERSGSSIYSGRSSPSMLKYVAGGHG